MMKQIKTILYSILSLLLLVGCSEQHHKRQEQFQQWIQDNGKVKVLSTTAMIDDLVKQIGGDHLDTLVLIQGELDPHSYQLVKGDDEKLAFAQLIFYNGIGLEHGPSLQQYLLQNPKAVSLGDHLYQHNPALIVHVNGQKDPHIWMDISLWAQTIPFIVEALSKKDPVHAKEYRLKGQKLMQAMTQAHQEAKTIMHQIPADKRYLVTSHDAFNYFARAYLSEDGEIESGAWEKRFAAPEGLAPESQLSASHIKEIINYLKQYQVHLIFPESNVSRDSIRKIIQAGKEEGLDVQIACCALYGDAMGQPGSEGDSYLKMILYNARTLASHMEPKLGREHSNNSQSMLQGKDERR